MNTPSLCPACRNPIPADAPGGICPSCALLGVAQPTIIIPPQGAPSRDEIAAAFPDLEVLEIIGQGGMGVVFKARQPRLDRIVALKILPPHLAAQPGFTERFTREARALAKLNHPNIVAVYDFGESGGFCYLVMEYVHGVNLRHAMRAGVKPEQAMLLVPRICEALQFAHDRGVLHRDIKPENILLDTAGTPKLADFGIAKLAGDPTSGLTMSGAALGTASYMAPEQIEKPATVDHRADIYSLGVVFYEMLTGELPIGRFAAPSQKSKVGESVDEVVMRALEKERELRQQSATEMKTQVESAREGVPVTFSGAGVEDEIEPSGVQHFLKLLTALSAVGIPASAVIPGLPRFITPAVMVFVTAFFGILSSLWPGGTRRRRRHPTRWAPPAPPVDPGAGPAFESRSRRTVFGMPLYHIVRGINPATGTAPVARGIFAIGPVAHGYFAMGGRAHGVFAIGGLATGIVTFGGISVGMFSLGGVALGLLCAVGGMTAGSLVFGGVMAGLARLGGVPDGHLADGRMIFGPLLDPSGELLRLLQNAAMLTGGIIAAITIVVLLAALFSSPPPVPETSARPAAPQRNPWPRRIFLLIALVVAAPVVMVVIWAFASYKVRPQGTSSYQSAPAVDVVSAERPPFAAVWDKGSVELVAVTEHPSGNAPWWRMDGLMSAEGPFTWPGGQAFAARGERAYEFVFHLRNLPEGASSPAWLVEHSRAGAGRGAPALKEKPESPLPGYFVFAATLPDSIDRTNIKIGVASGDWSTISESNPGNFIGKSLQYLGVEWKITHGTAIETKAGELAVTFTASRPADWESRVVAVDTDGKEISTSRESRVNDQSEWRFPNLTLAAVKEFRFQVRRFRWVEFRGVSLTPAR